MCGGGGGGGGMFDPGNLFGSGKNIFQSKIADPINLLGGGKNLITKSGDAIDKARGDAVNMIETAGHHAPPPVPPVPVDYTAEAAAATAKVAADATAAANQQLLTDARRKRAQKGLLPSDSVLASGIPAANNTVLGSGGA